MNEEPPDWPLAVFDGLVGLFLVSTAFGTHAGELFWFFLSAGVFCLVGAVAAASGSRGLGYAAGIAGSISGAIDFARIVYYAAMR